MYSYSSDNSHQVAKNSSDEKDDECKGSIEQEQNCVSLHRQQTQSPPVESIQNLSILLIRAVQLL